MWLTQTTAAGNDLTFQQFHSSDSASVHILQSFCPTIHFWSDISVDLIPVIIENFRRMIFDMFSSSLNLTIHNPKSNMDGEEWFHKVPFHHQYLKKMTWFIDFLLTKWFHGKTYCFVENLALFSPIYFKHNLWALWVFEVLRGGSYNFQKFDKNHTTSRYRKCQFHWSILNKCFLLWKPTLKNCFIFFRGDRKKYIAKQIKNSHFAVLLTQAPFLYLTWNWQ